MEREVIITDEYGLRSNGPTPNVTIRERFSPNLRANLAAQLVEKWGLVAGEPDGEDSSGRAKVRLSTPQEIANRACDTADLMIGEFERRGWMTPIPSYAEQIEYLKSKDDSAEKKR